MQRTRPMGGGASVLNTGQGGFSLLETLCALAISSVLVLGGLRMLPLLYRQAHGAMERTHLMWQMEHSLLSIEKDLRRAGHGTTPGAGPAVRIGARRGEAPNSCLILRYGYYSSDRRGPGHRLVNDTFGYRLHRGALETQRGVQHCNEPGWSKMHDSRRWMVRRFRCDPLGDNAWRVTLIGAATGYPGQHHDLQRVFVGRNG